MNDIVIETDDVPTRADIDALTGGLNAHSEPRVGQAGFVPVAAFARDEGGTLKGGVYAHINWRWLQVKLLWVSDEYRGRGLGVALMARIENLAVDRGCRQAHVDTFSFQARPFYERLGYQVFAELNDYPVGHSRYYLRKTLVRAETQA